MKVKKGDTVRVIAGKYKGAVGKVIVAYPKLDKVLVEGVNRVKKHTKITQSTRGSQQGGDLAVAVAAVLACERDDVRCQRLFIVSAPRHLALCRAMLAKRAAGAALGNS